MTAPTLLKDSETNWISKVPQDWLVLSIKRLSRVRRGSSPRPIDAPEYFDDTGEYAWVRISDVTASEGRLTSTTQKLSELGASYSVKLNPGDLFLSIAGSVGKPCITEIKCCIHDGFVYFPGYKGDKKFLFYIFESGEAYGGLGKLGTQLNLNTDTVGWIQIPYPTVEVQKSIANFLDRKTAAISTLIAKKQRLIQLLEEKRTALINQAVTKGLTPNTPMKDSGIPWIGEIPEHWEVRRLKFALQQLVDCKNRTPEYVDDGKYAVVRTTNIRQGKFLSENLLRTNRANYEKWTQRAIPQSGHIIFTREAPAGEACKVPELPKVCLGQRTMLFIPNQRCLTSNFLLLSIYGGAVDGFVKSASSGSTVSHLRVEQVGDLPIFVPPLLEQKSISEEINFQLERQDNLVAITQLSIEKLREYRRSLITAAVTGKLDISEVDSNV
uniref:Type I restriction-modification system specificity determinant n=1 Tax=Acaryochloris sp. HICR111A TaxID=576912 RepID=I6UE72_9CYAN|nr:type I restriction-modification system specificity determinant [Acaryochloris sp. HICR111A]